MIGIDHLPVFGVVSLCVCFIWRQLCGSKLILGLLFESTRYPPAPYPLDRTDNSTVWTTRDELAAGVRRWLLAPTHEFWSGGRALTGGLKERRLAALCTLAEQCEVLEPALLATLSEEERRRADSRLSALRTLIERDDGGVEGGASTAARSISVCTSQSCMADTAAAAAAAAPPALHAVLTYVVKREQSWSSWF